MTRTIPNSIDRVIDKLLLWAIPPRFTPNQFTILRFISVPFVLYYLAIGDFVVGAALFILSAATDAIDGALARTRDQITDWGRIYDPLADKLLIGGTMLILMINNLNPILAFSIIAVDLITGFVAIYKTKVKDKIINPHFTGKLKMVLQSVGISLLLMSLIFKSPLIFTISEAILVIALVLGVIGLVIYKSA